MTLMGTFWTFSSRFVAVMMISVWSGIWPSCAVWTLGGGAITSVALVPGAGDWPVARGCEFCASAGLASAVEARSPRVSARNLVIRMPPFGSVSPLRQTHYRKSTALSHGRKNVALPLRERRRGIGVGVEHRTQRVLERAEVPLVRAPFVRGVAIDRPAHLLGACRPHRPLGLVELQHLRLELQAAMVEQTPDFGFGVVDHPLVNHAMHAAWQNRVDMGHQPHIVCI